MGMNYLQFMRDLPKRKVEEGDEFSFASAGAIRKTEISGNIRNHENMIIADKKNKSDAVTRKSQKLRINAKLKEIELIRSKLNNETLDPNERLVLLDRYKMMINLLEQKAASKEILMKYLPKGGIEENEEGDIEEIYVNAIQSKLALLGKK